VLEGAVRESPDVQAAEGVELRTREEAAFYGIWRDELDGVRPEATLGLFATT